MKINFNNKLKKEKDSYLIKISDDESKSLGEFEIVSKDELIFFYTTKKDENENREVFRKLANVIYNFCKKQKFENLNIELNDFVVEFLEGFLLSDYKFDKYLSKKDDFNFKSINIISSKSYEKELEKIQLIVKNVNIVRDWVNENANIITPQSFAEMTKDFFKKTKVEVEIFDDKRIQKENLNLIYAVGKGSVNKPRFVILKYMPVKNGKLYSIIGKGVTYDTGGYYLKPSPGMNEMKGDMAGAATALAGFKSLVELGVKKNFVIALPLAENSVNGEAYKPGEFFTSYSGQSVEIKHTDAEGRLILADAISYVDINYKPDLIVDLATLTGAIIVALGNNLIGMFGDDKNYKSKMFEAGEKTGERVWELPVYDEHKEAIKNTFADVQNIGADGKAAGSITAAAFLMSFVKNSTLIHLDIAAAALTTNPYFYWPSVGTGRGVRLLIEFFENLEN